MHVIGYDEKLGVRIFRGMSERILWLGPIWVLSLALPREAPRNWGLVSIALSFFGLTAIILSITSRGNVENHHRFGLVLFLDVSIYIAIAACYLERGEPNNPSILFFTIPIAYEAVAQRGPKFFALPMVLGIGSFAACQFSLDQHPGDIATNTFLIGGFMAVLYFVMSFLVNEARRTASVSTALARVAGIVANSATSKTVLLHAESDILLLTSASAVRLLEPDEELTPVESDGRTIVFAATGRRLVFEGTPDPAAAETVGDLFQILEHRQLTVDELKLRSTTDPLTGLGNRRILERLTVEPEATATAVMIDLDHFKLYNDQHGHRAGDELLVDFAATLRSCIRSHDMLVRYGGEEFCYVLSCDMHVAKIVTKRVRDLWSEHPSGVTFSAGLAAIEPHETTESAINRADVALYISKRDGRNTSTVFSNGDETLTLG